MHGRSASLRTSPAKNSLQKKLNHIKHYFFKNKIHEEGLLGLKFLTNKFVQVQRFVLLNRDAIQISNRTFKISDVFYADGVG